MSQLPVLEAVAMQQQDTFPAEIAGRFRNHVVLKRDVFSTVERGFFTDGDQEIESVLRRIDLVPWWTFGIARHFLHREARALAIAGKLAVAPVLIYGGRRTLVRSWIEALPLHIARPQGDLAYFRSAKERLARPAPAQSHTTISPRSRTGCARRRPLHAHRFPARHLVLPPPGCSGSPPMRICGIC